MRRLALMLAGIVILAVGAVIAMNAGIFVSVLNLGN